MDKKVKGKNNRLKVNEQDFVLAIYSFMMEYHVQWLNL